MTASKSAAKASFALFSSLIFTILFVGATGCGPHPGPDNNTIQPVLPDPKAVQGATQITTNLPGSGVSYGGNTGQISVVTGPGLTNVPPGTTPVPLVETRGTDEGSRAGAMLEFFEHHKDAFNLSSAADELRIARDPINDRTRPQPGAQARDLGSASGLQIQHLHRAFKGVHVYGQFATGVFDAAGNLHGLITRLLPMPANLNVTPSLDSQGALILMQDAHLAKKTATYTQAGQLQWVDAATDSSAPIDEHTEELLLLPVDRTNGRIASPTAAVDYRLVYEVRMRTGASASHGWIDAVTGEILDFHGDDQFATWQDSGQDMVAGSNDELSNYQLFLTDQYNGNWYMAITGNNFASTWLASSSFVSIDNLYTAANRNKFYAQPISIPTTINNAPNYWNTDPTFSTSAQLRQSARFMRNLAAAEDWWTARNWVGWDNQGGTFYLAIGMKKSTGASEDLNAWGGNGTLAIGGASTGTNQYLGSSMTVVGHEYTHNFITATSALEYHDESGATNEALADIFGKAITSKNNTFDGTDIGGDVGFAIRDMADPTKFGQPDRYSNYVVTTADSNGVHTNSGIFNKAHGLLVLGGTFNNITVPSIGVAETEKILRLANVYKSFPKTASMEEFANGVLDMCHITDAINQVFGDTHYGPICKAFKKAYQAVEVLPRDKLINLKPGWASLVASQLVVGVSNHSFSPADLGRLKVSLVDVSSNLIAANVRQIITDDQNTSQLQPGDDMKLVLDLPDSIRSGLRKNATNIGVRVELSNDGLGADQDYMKTVSTSVGADFDGVRADIGIPTDGIGKLGVVLENRTGTGFPSGLGAVLLTRVTSYGLLLPAKDASGNLAEATLSADTDAATVTLPLESTFMPNGSPYSIIQLQGGSEIPGMPGRYQVWFDSNGGLPELNDHTQFYVLVDPRNVTTELNKTNNLVCLNCRVPGQAANDPNGVIVRLPYNAPITSLFTSEYQAAASLLPAANRIPFQVQEILAPSLNFRPVVSVQ